MGRKLAIDQRQIEHRCNRTHMVIVRHHLFKAERIKQLPLIPLQPTHHGPFPPLTAPTSGNHCSRKPSTDFCNNIGTKRTCLRSLTMSALEGRTDMSHLGRDASIRPRLCENASEPRTFRVVFSIALCSSTYQCDWFPQRRIEMEFLRASSASEFSHS